MGTVYLGAHVDTGDLAAIKILPPSMAHEEGFVARFGREITAMKNLQSPQIVELYESGEDLGTYYYAMEYVPGETLTERLKREKRIPWQEVIEIAVQVCKALKAAHNSGIVHRDLKPSNLLLSSDGQVKLSDFGIAQVFASSKLTITGGILGTAEYMSPEQAQGRRATKQSDIYSLGAVMYVMLTGRPPFTGKTTLDIIQKHKFSQFDSPKRMVSEIPFWLDEVVCKCLEKKPENRYPDAYVLMLRLQEIVKKIELKNAGGDESPFSADAATAADSPLQDGEGHIGGTLARDLFRMQAEADERPSVLHRWLDNTWVLMGLLVLLVVGTYLLLQVRSLNPETRFAHGESIMQEPEGPDWDIARDRYFQPLLERDAETWGPRVQPHLDRIRLYELKKKLLGKGISREPLPRSEPEAVLRQILELRQFGKNEAALTKLTALATLIQDQTDFEQYAGVLESLKEELTRQATTDRFQYVEQALARAAELQKSGKLAEAREIWRSVVALYDSDPGAQSLVSQARKLLAETPE